MPWRLAEGVLFDLTSLSEKRMIEKDGKEMGWYWLVPGQTIDSVTHRYNILQREEKATIPSWKGSGWRLVDDVPATVQPENIPNHDRRHFRR